MIFSKIRKHFSEELARYKQGKNREDDYIILVKRRTYGKRQMGAVLEKIGGTLNERFEKIKPRINSTVTLDTEKELTNLWMIVKRSMLIPTLWNCGGD